MKAHLHQRWHVAKLISLRGLRSGLRGAVLPFALTFAFLFAAVLIADNVGQLGQKGLLAIPRPLTYPFFSVVYILSFYLALAGALAIVRDRDRGTMETLFYGPVDEVSYIFGRFFEHLLLFIAMLVLTIIFFLLASLITRFAITVQFWQACLLSVFLAAGVIAFGIFISSITKRTINAVVLFLVLMLLFMGIQITQQSLANIDLSNPSAGLALAVKVITFLGKVVSWVSPFSYLSGGLRAVDLASTGQYVLSLVKATVYALVLHGASIYFFQRRGVRK